MTHDPLAMKIGALTRPCPALMAMDSLSRAASLLRDASTGVLPVTESGKLVGVVTDVALTHALAEGAAWTDAIGPLIEPAPTTFTPETSGAEVLRHLSDSGLANALVLSHDGYLIGVVGVGDLCEPPEEGPRPAQVGGMATPLGVYLTNGSLRAGASDFALVLTGFMLFAAFLAASYAGEGLASLFPTIARTNQGDFWFRDVAPLAFFLLGFRLTPIAGIHAAEHKVVHAIERGEPLEPDVVKRMPRVHPRCGTNIATGMALFVGIWHVEWIPDDKLRLVAAAIVTLGAWRPLGGLVQLLVTTKPPNDRQIDMGIRSAKELLEMYAVERGRPPSFGRRLYASGMFHALAGSMLGGMLYIGISYACGQSLPL